MITIDTKVNNRDHTTPYYIHIFVGIYRELDGDVTQMSQYKTQNQYTNIQKNK